MGGTQISSTDMTAFTNFVNTVTWLPNPYQNLNRTYPTSLEGGNAQKGQTEFINTPVDALGNTCNTCHTATNFGSDLDIFLLADAVQPMKATLLRATYQKELFNSTGPTIDGFGILHDGGEENIHTFVGGNLFPSLAGKKSVQNDISAFNLSMDTGTAPAVGYGVTLTAANVSTSANTTAWSTLESQAGLQYADLVANGTVHGVVSGLLYVPTTKLYQQKPSGPTYTHQQVVSLVEAGDTLTILGVPYGAGSRIAALSARK
jgi:hypothetical protein